MAVGEWIPLYINPEGLRVSVLGGGSLGERRARLFASAGARVRVYALHFTPGLRELAGRGLVELREADLTVEDALLDAVRWGQVIVVATGNPRVDERAARVALRMGKLVNNGVDARAGNVIVPFQGKTSYGLRYAVTSLGETGIAARRARDRIGECLEDRELATLYRVMARVKRVLKERVAPAKRRIPLYFRVEEDPLFMEYIRRGDESAALARALEIIEEALQQPTRG